MLFGVDRGVFDVLQQQSYIRHRVFVNHGRVVFIYKIEEKRRARGFLWLVQRKARPPKRGAQEFNYLDIAPAIVNAFEQ